MVTVSVLVEVEKTSDEAVVPEFELRLSEAQTSLRFVAMVTVNPAGMLTVSLDVGTPDGDQVEVVFQLPFATAVRCPANPRNEKSVRNTTSEKIVKRVFMARPLFVV